MSNLEKQEKTKEIEDKEKGVILNMNLDPKSLIIKDNEELKLLLSKSFKDMTEEEKKKLPTARARVFTKVNAFEKKNERYVRVLFTEGVYFERKLDTTKGEDELLKCVYPKLFEIPKKKEDIQYIDVPVRLYAYYDENYDRYTYLLSAEIYDGILVRSMIKENPMTKKKKAINSFNEVQLKLMLIRKLDYKFCLLDKRVDEELTEEYIED